MRKLMTALVAASFATAVHAHQPELHAPPICPQDSYWVNAATNHGDFVLWDLESKGRQPVVNGRRCETVAGSNTIWLLCRYLPLMSVTFESKRFNPDPGMYLSFYKAGRHLFLTKEVFKANFSAARDTFADKYKLAGEKCLGR